MERLSTLSDASRNLPWEAPSPVAMRDLEATILKSAREFPLPTPSRSKLAIPALGAALSLALLVVWIAGTEGERKTETSPEERSQLVASGDARYERVTLHPSQVDDPVTEKVHLLEGTIWLEVETLGAEERFVVSTEDAEVEVRGTRFEVAAREGKLLRVSVQEGAVEVRHGGGSWLLHPGELWEPEPAVVAEPPPDHATTAEVPAPLPAPAPASRAKVAPQPPPKLQRPGTEPQPSHAEPEPSVDEPRPGHLAMLDATPPLGERAFFAGWTALRSGDPAAAATHFEEVSRMGADPGLLADAAYWRIVALARSGGEQDAEREMETFLRHHAGADREAEVALMLGLRRMRAGALADARRLLEQAARTGTEPLKSRANAALLQIAE